MSISDKEKDAPFWYIVPNKKMEGVKYSNDKPVCKRHKKTFFRLVCGENYCEKCMYDIICGKFIRIVDKGD